MSDKHIQELVGDAHELAIDQILITMHPSGHTVIAVWPDNLTRPHGEDMMKAYVERNRNADYAAEKLLKRLKGVRRLKRIQELREVEAL